MTHLPSSVRRQRVSSCSNDLQKTPNSTSSHHHLIHSPLQTFGCAQWRKGSLRDSILKKRAEGYIRQKSYLFKVNVYKTSWASPMQNTESKSGLGNSQHWLQESSLKKYGKGSCFLEKHCFWGRLNYIGKEGTYWRCGSEENKQEEETKNPAETKGMPVPPPTLLQKSKKINKARPHPYKTIVKSQNLQQPDSENSLQNNDCEAEENYNVILQNMFRQRGDLMKHLEPEIQK